MMRLTYKEKRYGLALVAFVCGWSLYSFALEPAVDRLGTLRRVIPEKQQELAELRRAGREYTAMQQSLQTLREKVARQERFDLLPHVEKLISRAGLDKHVRLIKPRIVPLEDKYEQVIVELDFAPVSLDKLVDFLCKMDESDVLADIKTLHIRKATSQPDLLECSVEIHSIRLADSFTGTS